MCTSGEEHRSTTQQCEEDDKHTAPRSFTVALFPFDRPAVSASSMAHLKLLPLDNSDLYNRRQHEQRKHQIVSSNAYQGAFCAKCMEGFASGEVFVKTDDRYYHNECFRCAQCFEMLHQQEHYAFEGRNYCSHDFKVLYAPSCENCKEFIEGVVIRTSYGNWHPHCLTCTQCHKSLQSKEGVYIINGSNYCFDCKELADRKMNCYCAKCNQIVEPTHILRYKLEIYHPYHFNCAKCNVEVDETARVYEDDVYCLRCYDLEKSKICYACKVAIDYQREQSVVALDRFYHPKCFTCTICAYPLHSVSHQIVRKQPICEKCYVEVHGNACFMCGQIQRSQCLRVLNKVWCTHCYVCTTCNKKLTTKSKILDVDSKPVCKKCFEKMPKELRKRLHP